MEGSGRRIIEVLFRKLPGRTEKNHGKSFRVVGRKRYRLNEAGRSSVEVLLFLGFIIYSMTLSQFHSSCNAGRENDSE